MEALERAIDAAGSAKALADALNVVPSAIGNWRRRGAIPPAQAIAIHRKFQISLDDLTAHHAEAGS